MAKKIKFLNSNETVIMDGKEEPIVGTIEIGGMEVLISGDMNDIIQCERKLIPAHVKNYQKLKKEYKDMKMHKACLDKDDRRLFEKIRDELIDLIDYTLTKELVTIMTKELDIINELLNLK